VDTRLDENQTELAVLVFSVALEVLSDGDSLLDEHVEVLWDLGCEAVALEDSQDLVTGDDLDLGDTVAVTEDNTDLRGRGALLRELADLVDDLLGSGLEPCRGRARVGDGGGGNSLAVAVHATHLGG